jgi:hypothetical protein
VLDPAEAVDVVVRRLEALVAERAT